MLNTEQQNKSSLPLSFQYGKAPDEVMDREIKVTGSARAKNYSTTIMKPKSRWIPNLRTGIRKNG